MIVSFQDFTRKLAFQHLKNTSAVDDQDAGEIDPLHEDQLLELVNQGLIDITSKKKIFEGTGVLTFVSGTNIYTLDTAPTETFEDFAKLLQIEAVHKDYEVIDENKKVFTVKSNKHITQPSHETIRFSDWFMENYGPAVDVKFQKLHSSVAVDGNIDLPSHMYEYLLLYVAGLFLSQMGGEENSAKGDSYYGLYLKMMTDDTIGNLSGTSEVTDEDTRFNDRGFV